MVEAVADMVEETMATNKIREAKEATATTAGQKIIMVNNTTPQMANILRKLQIYQSILHQ